MSSFIIIPVQTKKQFEMVDITEKVVTSLTESGIQNGMLTIFCPHTTASIRLNHNEPLLLQDIMKTFYHLVPMDVSYGHDLFEIRQNIASNERSNGHSHIKAFFLGSSETLIIDSGKLILGDKQSIFFVEFDGGRNREVYIKVMGE